MFEKLRTSGYLKTIIISLVIILLGVGTVVALDWYDAAQQPAAQPPVESPPAESPPAGGSDAVGGNVPGAPTGGESATPPEGEMTFPPGTTPPEGGMTLQPGAGGGIQMKRDEDGTVHYYDADGNEVDPPQRQFQGQPGGEGRGAQGGLSPAQPPAETLPEPTKQGD